jgi:hypothetical protein
MMRALDRAQQGSSQVVVCDRGAPSVPTGNCRETVRHGSSQKVHSHIALGSFADGRRLTSFLSSLDAGQGAVLGRNDRQRNLRGPCCRLLGYRLSRPDDFNGVRIHSCDGCKLVRVECALRVPDMNVRCDHRCSASSRIGESSSHDQDEPMRPSGTAASISARIAASSFFGEFTRFEMGQIVISVAGWARNRSAGSASCPSHRP